MVNPDHPPKKGRKRWLAAILAAALAVVEVILPHATPLAEAVVTVLDLEEQLAPAEPLPLGVEPVPGDGVSRPSAS